MKRIREARIPSLQDTTPDLPKGLEEVVMSCLKARPEDRIASARELLDALAPFIDKPPLSAAEALAELLIELFPEKHREFTRDFNNGVIRI